MPKLISTEVPKITKSQFLRFALKKGLTLVVEKAIFKDGSGEQLGNMKRPKVYDHLEPLYLDYRSKLL